MITNHVSNVFKAHYLPAQFLSIDESLAGTHEWSKIIQFMPNKRHSRFGVKLWMLIESATKFCYQLFLHRVSKYDKVPKKGLSYGIVIRLLRISNFLNWAYHVVVDNVFTGIQLARDLLSVGTFLTATIKLKHKIHKALMLLLARRNSGGTSNYFFPPSPPPKKPNVTQLQSCQLMETQKNIVAKQKIKPSVFTKYIINTWVEWTVTTRCCTPTMMKAKQ